MKGTGGRDVHVDRDELLARVNLPGLLDFLTGPSQRHRWHCPDRDHPDDHPSVTVRVGNDGIGRWRCWSGGHGGTAIDAVALNRGVDVGSAIRWLATHHASLPVGPAAPALSRRASIGQPDLEVRLYVERAEHLLWTSAGRRHRDWLAARGLDEATLRANRVGADPGRRYLPRPRGLPGGWPAVIYPALTPAGAVSYLQARYLEPPPGRAKYDNPAASLAANPRLGWTRPPRHTTARTALVVCEGVADALVAARAGFRAVGVLGAAYPDDLIADGIVAATSPGCGEVVVLFDNDVAGQAGAGRLVELLAARSLTATPLAPPPGMDLTDWALTDPQWPSAVPTRIPAAASPAAPAGVVGPMSINL